MRFNKMFNLQKNLREGLFKSKVIYNGGFCYEDYSYSYLNYMDLGKNGINLYTYGSYKLVN